MLGSDEGRSVDFSLVGVIVEFLEGRIGPKSLSDELDAFLVELEEETAGDPEGVRATEEGARTEVSLRRGRSAGRAGFS